MNDYAKSLKILEVRYGKPGEALTREVQNNRHVRHTDSHAKHNLTGIIPINIRQKHRKVQEAYITTHTQKMKTRSHI